MRKSAVLLALLLCAPAQAKCLLPSQKPMTEAELFFGRDIAGGDEVSDEDWADFVDGVVARDFPGGFTVSDAEGAWRDAKTADAVHEDSKIVLIDAAATPAFAKKLKHIADNYRARFHQNAVGIVTREVCAAF